MFYVNILENSKGRRYVGFTEDLQRRVEEHNAGQNLSTKSYRPWAVIFYEAYRNRQDALRRESYLKTTQGRRALLRMLSEYNKSLVDKEF